MSLNEQRIKEIANQEFAQASDADIQTWLRGAITGWSTEHTVLSFSPFQNFFPSTQDEADSLSQILTALPSKKVAGKAYSIRDQFRKALASLIATRDVYLENPDIWVFVFDLAREIELSECVGAIIPILADARFRSNTKSAGIPLFDTALRMSFSFSPTTDVVAFWNASIPYIDEAPHLSSQLLVRLIETKPSLWADYALETKISIALIQYRQAQEEVNQDACENRFARLRSQISAYVSDREYLNGVEKLKYQNLAFLIDIQRVQSLVKPEVVVEKNKPRRRSFVHPKNLRNAARNASVVAFQLYPNQQHKVASAW